MKHGLSLVHTKRGRRIELSREVGAPARTAWRLFADVAAWPAWGPLVTDVEYAGRSVSEATNGRVQVLWLLWLPFRIVTVETMRWTWTVRGWTPPADGHRVDGIADDRCRAALELPLWGFWYLPLCWLALFLLARLAESDPERDFDHLGEPLRE